MANNCNNSKYAGMGQAKLMRFITEISFMVDDISLFLDTHPDDIDAIDEYKKYKSIREEAVEAYLYMFGPLNRYDVNPENYWCWFKMPWPWEKECGN